MLATLQHGTSNNVKHFFYGGAEGVAELLKRHIEAMYPEVKIVGTYCPPFRKLTDNEDKKVIELINKSEADIVWVGLGAPKQEIWMYDHLTRINPAVMIGVGATVNLFYR